MGLPVDIGTGTSILFGTSGFAAELTSVSMDGISREIVETSHLGTPIAGAGKLGSKTFIAGDLSDPGTLSIEGHFDADIIPPLEAAAELITITFPLGAGESVATTWARNYSRIPRLKPPAESFLKRPSTWATNSPPIWRLRSTRRWPPTPVGSAFPPPPPGRIASRPP